MARPLEMQWQGGEHPFLLRIGELRAIDDRVQDGAMAAFGRLRAMRPRFDDVYEVVRQGLIGGGMASRDAANLVAKIEEQHGLGPMIPLAQAILFQAFYRREEDEDAGEMNRSTESPAATD
jgi:hypothetical protein